jgi:tetratricopeptide (TPR) repeat protein
MKNSRTSFWIILLCLVFGITPVHSGEIRNDNFEAIELYNQAVDQASAGHFYETVNLTDRALSIQPNFTLALVTRAGAYLGLGDTEKAEESVQRALILNPDNPSVLASAASVCLQKGMNREAISYAEQATAADPSMIEAWIIKGTAHGNLGEYSEEISASEQALLISPGYGPALSNRDYARSMMSDSTKTPLGVQPVFLSLTILVFLIRKRI